MTRIIPPAPVKGRFAPSPTGRMHLGNIFTALMVWLSARSAGGVVALRMEDLDSGRSSADAARLIEEDLEWLGLHADEGPVRQSERSHLYEAALGRLRSQRLTYGCRCTRADLRAAAGAPHASDGLTPYSGRCRPAPVPPMPPLDMAGARAERLWTPDESWCFTDRLRGSVTCNLARDCGDITLRRADGMWAYQLAVVVDDALMGVTEVVRGGDLLRSTPIQLYLRSLLGYTTPPPQHMHVPLICNAAGTRLGKRDSSLSMEELRRRCSPDQLLGILARLASLGDGAPCTFNDLLGRYSPERLRTLPERICVDESTLSPLNLS